MKKWYILPLAAMLIALAACGAHAAATVPAETSTPAPTAAATPAPTPAPTPEPTPTVITLALGGDLVMHVPLHKEAECGEGYDYVPVFGDAVEYFENADLALCCLEASLTGDGELMGYPYFRAPDDLADSIKDIGVDLVNMANNHTMDGYGRGVVRTLDVLDAAGLDHVGAYRSAEERARDNGVVVEDINGVTIAFLDYTYGTNAISIKGKEYYVNVYTHDYMTYYQDIDYDMLSADMAAARALDTDLIAVSLHWGAEYNTIAYEPQKVLADFLFEQGADIIIGGHPHVPQPMELRTVTDSDGAERTGFICYSLGNLLSCQKQPDTDLTAIVELEITKDPATGKTEITNVGYIPMIMIDPRDYGVYNADFNYRLWDLRAALADYEAGDDRGVMTENMYSRLVGKLKDAREILGELELG